MIRRVRPRRSRQRLKRRRLRQQRIDELEQPRDAAPVPFDELPPTGAHSAARLGVGKEPLQDFAQFRRIRDLHCAARAHQRAGDVTAVGIVGPHDHRHAERRRLQQIVPSHRHQTTADECHVGRRIQRRQFAHGVDQQHLRVGPHRLSDAAAIEANCAPLQQLRHALEPLRMPRHQHQHCIREPRKQRGVRVEQRLLLAAMGAARDPCWPGADIARAQLAPLLQDQAPWLHIELHVADDVRTLRIGADGDEALGILGGLRRDEAAARHRAAEQGAETAIPRHGFRRQARTREHHRHAAPPAFVEQIGPQFRLHDDCQARADTRQETPHRTGSIVGQKADADLSSEERLRARAPRRSRGAQHERN